MIGIYSIKNKITNEVYVGSSNNIKKRWNYHKNRLDSGRHDNPKLQNAWNKYGSDNFEFGIVLCTSESLLLDMEQVFIDAIFGSECYNLNKKAEKPPGTLGKKIHNDEFKKQMSERFKGRPKPEGAGKNFIKGQTAFNKGIAHSEQTKLKMKLAWMRRKANKI